MDKNNDRWELKYRPQSFAEVVGQTVNTRILESTIANPYHTMIFQGTSGCGKTTVARIYGNVLNAHILEVDAASNNGVDNMRGILELVRLSPLSNKYRVVVVDECIHGSEALWCRRRDGSVVSIRMNKLVKNREDVQVLSIDTVGNLCWANIEKYHKNSEKSFRQYNFKIVGTSDIRRVVCTQNHLIHKVDGNYVPASLLKEGDLVIGARKNVLEVGAARTNVYLKKVHSWNISSQALEMIHGTLLGDSYLGMVHERREVLNATPRLVCSYGRRQIGYRKEMARILGDVMATWEDPAPAVGEKVFENSCVGRFVTKCNEMFLPFFDELYYTGRKRVTRKYLDGLTDLGLAVWFMDDGSCGRLDGTPLKSPTASLHTEGYSFEEVVTIKEFFADRYGWEAKISRDSRMEDASIGFYLTFNVVNTKELLSTVAPYVTPDLEYKLAGYCKCGNALSRVAPIGHTECVDPERLSKAKVNFEFGFEELEFIGESEINKCAKTYSNYSYDLTTSTGNYFVGSVSVHNCHMLSTGAWNSALKAIEEPNSSTIWIFCTTEFQKVPTTIRGRSVTFKFYPVKADVIVGRLRTILGAEGQSLNDEVLYLIANNCNGQVRDAVKNLQQCVYTGVETEEQFNKLFGIPDLRGMRAYIESVLDRSPANGLKVLRNLEVDFYDWKIRLEGLLQEMMWANFGIQTLRAKGAQAEKLLEIAGKHSPRLFGLFLDKLARIRDSADAKTRLATICLVGVE